MELDLEIRRRALRKLDLEIQKLEREVSISVHIITITVIQRINIYYFCSPFQVPTNT